MIPSRIKKRKPAEHTCIIFSSSLSLFHTYTRTHTSLSNVKLHSSSCKVLSCIRLCIQVLLQQQSLASLVLVLIPWRNRWRVISFDQDKVSIPYSSLMLLTENVTLASIEEGWTTCSSRWIHLTSYVALKGSVFI